MQAKIKPLRSLIYAKYNSETEMATSMGWSRQRLNKITNGVKEPTVRELNQISKALDSSIMIVAEIFLSSRSPNSDKAS